jgi:hypothetical protein
MNLRLPAADHASAHLAHLAPFPAADIGFVPVGRHGLIALHAFLDAAQDRLTAVNGPDGWSFTSRRIDDFAIVGTVTVRGVVRESIGFGTTAAAREASALKRAAARHGIGRYIARTRRIIKPVGVGTLALDPRPDGSLAVGEKLEQALRDDYTATSLPALTKRYGLPLGRHDDTWTPPEAEPAGDPGQWAARLAAPFAASAVGWVIVERYDDDSPYGIVTPYVPRVSYEDRLDAAHSAAGWECSIVEWGPDTVTVAVTVAGVTHHGIGDGSTRYLQEARAFKRACKQHGIARYLARRDLGMRHMLPITNTADGLVADDHNRLRIGSEAYAALSEHYAHALAARIEPIYGPALDHHDQPEQFGDDAEADEPLAASAGATVDPAALVQGGMSAAGAAQRFGLVIGGAVSAAAPASGTRADVPPLRLATPAASASPPATTDAPTDEAAAPVDAPGAQADAPAPAAPANGAGVADAPADAPAEDRPPAEAERVETEQPAVPTPTETLVEVEAPQTVIDAMNELAIPDPIAVWLLRTVWCVPSGQLEFSDTQLDSMRTVLHTVQEASIDTSDLAALLASAQAENEEATDRCTAFCKGLLSLAQERSEVRTAQASGSEPIQLGTDAGDADRAEATAPEDEHGESGAAEQAEPVALDAERLAAAQERLRAEAEAADLAETAFEEAINRSGFTKDDVQRIFTIVTGEDGDKAATPEQTEQAAEIVELATRLGWDSSQLATVLDQLEGAYDTPQERVVALLDYQRRSAQSEAA